MRDALVFFSGFNLISIKEDKNMYLHQQNLIKKYMDTNDENLIIEIAILISLPPVADHIEAINILKKLSLNTNNINVYFLGSYLMNEYVFDEDNCFLVFLFDSLNRLTSEKNKSIACYLIGKHFKKVKEKEKAIFYFKKSIEYNSECVNSYLELSELLWFQCGQKYKDIAKSNVKYILSEKRLSNMPLEYFTSFDNFVEEYILGITLTESVYSFHFDNQNNTGDGTMSSVEE